MAAAPILTGMSADDSASKGMANTWKRDGYAKDERRRRLVNGRETSTPSSATTKYSRS